MLFLGRTKPRNKILKYHLRRYIIGKTVLLLPLLSFGAVYALIPVIIIIILIAAAAGLNRGASLFELLGFGTLIGSVRGIGTGSGGAGQGMRRIASYRRNTVTQTQGGKFGGGAQAFRLGKGGKKDSGSPVAPPPPPTPPQPKKTEVPRVTLTFLMSSREPQTFFGKNILHTPNPNTGGQIKFGKVAATNSLANRHLRQGRWTREALQNQSEAGKSAGKTGQKSGSTPKNDANSLRKGKTGLAGIAEAAKTIGSSYALFYGTYYNPKNFANPRRGAKYHALENAYRLDAIKAGGMTPLRATPNTSGGNTKEAMDSQKNANRRAYERYNSLKNGGESVEKGAFKRWREGKNGYQPKPSSWSGNTPGSPSNWSGNGPGANGPGGETSGGPSNWSENGPGANGPGGETSGGPSNWSENGPGANGPGGRTSGGPSNSSGNKPGGGGASTGGSTSGNKTDSSTSKQGEGGASTDSLNKAEGVTGASAANEKLIVGGTVRKKKMKEEEEEHHMDNTSIKEKPVDLPGSKKKKKVEGLEQEEEHGI
jgi:hypothetical protein